MSSSGEKLMEALASDFATAGAIGVLVYFVVVILGDETTLNPLYELINSLTDSAILLLALVAGLLAWGIYSKANEEAAKHDAYMKSAERDTELMSRLQARALDAREAKARGEKLAAEPGFLPYSIMIGKMPSNKALKNAKHYEDPYQEKHDDLQAAIAREKMRERMGGAAYDAHFRHFPGPRKKDT